MVQIELHKAELTSSSQNNFDREATEKNIYDKLNHTARLNVLVNTIQWKILN